MAIEGRLCQHEMYQHASTATARHCVPSARGASWRRRRGVHRDIEARRRDVERPAFPYRTAFAPPHRQRHGPGRRNPRDRDHPASVERHPSQRRGPDGRLRRFQNSLTSNKLRHDGASADGAGGEEVKSRPDVPGPQSYQTGVTQPARCSYGQARNNRGSIRRRTRHVRRAPLASTCTWQSQTSTRPSP
jgi:hypothetical protein